MPKRGHIRIGRAFGQEMQEKVLRDAGVTAIYTDDIEGAIRSLRAGDPLYVAGLRGLAGSRTEILAAVKAIHARNAYVVDAATGRRSDGKDGIELMGEAAIALTNERMGGHQNAKKFGKRGGKKSGKNRADRKTPLAIAQGHWFDKSIVDTDAAMAKINSYGYPDAWTYGALYAKWGKRDVQTGRRPKK